MKYEIKLTMLCFDAECLQARVQVTIGYPQEGVSILTVAPFDQTSAT